MTDSVPARIGQWYQHLDKGEAFLVTGRDERTGNVEIQSFDGDLDEIDPDSWSQMHIMPSEQPEDWTGPIDTVPRDDLGYSETVMKGTDWEAPLRTIAVTREDWESVADGSDDVLQVQATPDEDLRADNTVARDLARNERRSNDVR